jgi:hypothetical protein
MANWAEINEELMQGKDIDLSYTVTVDGLAYDMSGLQLDMRVIDETDTVIKTWSSGGISPVISIAINTFRILDTTGFLGWGFFRGELIDNTNDDTIASFEFVVEKQITAPTI